MNAKSDLLCKGKARDAENEREQKEESLHQVWFRGNSIEHGILRVRKMMLGSEALTSPTSGGMDRKARAERVEGRGLEGEAYLWRAGTSRI